MTDQSKNDEVGRVLKSDVDFDGERDVVEEEVEEGLPSQLDALFEEPVPDAIDQRRVVLLESDDHEA